MSKKSQHNNILLAVIGFTAVVIIVGVIGFFTLEHDDETIQGEIEVSEYRVSCKLPGRIVEIRVKEGDYVHVGDTLAILEVPEVKSQEKMLQATNEATMALQDLTDAGARKEQVQGAYQLYQQAMAAAEIAKKTYTRIQNLFNEGVMSGQKPMKLLLPIRPQKLRCRLPRANTKWPRMVPESKRREWLPAILKLLKVQWM